MAARATRTAGPCLLLAVAVAACAPMPARESGHAFPPHTAFVLPAAAAPVAEAPLPQVEGLSRVTFAGFDALRLEAPGGTAVVALFGGHLLSWVPRGGQDVLWLSPDTARPPQPIRGGVPVLWPYFSRQGQTAALPAHGLVRTQRWQVVEATRAPDGTLTLVLAPPQPVPGLALRMTLRVGQALEQTLTTLNTGTTPVRFTQALHSYYRVGDAMQVRVNGLQGATYRNKAEGFATAYVQQGPWSLTAAGGQVDRIYTGTDGHYVLDDPVLDRRIVLDTTGSHSLVTWNPGVAAQTRSPDIGSGWRHYVCLETANAGDDVVVLAPGAQHRLGYRVTVQQR